MSSIKNAVNHFRTITKHRHTVMGLCFKVGLYRQGLLHDMSKYAPCEFITGIKYYQGIKSPNAAEKLEKGYSGAWLHHKGRNRHHFEYWFDLSYRQGRPAEVAGAKMPLRYVLEMACDRIAACRTYHGSSYTDRDPLEYYDSRSYAVEAALHPDTAALLKHVLRVLAEEGEAKAVEYMRWILKNPKVYEEGYKE